MRHPPSYVPLVTRIVDDTVTLPVEVQVAPVMLPPPPLLLLLLLLPPEGVADAAFELVVTPFAVFLIQNQYVVPFESPVAV